MTLGRFLTQDPLPGSPTAPQTQNRYAYALNNPVNNVDPTGLATESVGGGGLLLTAGLASEGIGPCNSDELLAVAIIHTAVLLIAVPGLLFLANPATFALGVILLEYLVLPVEIGNTVLTLHACGII